MKTKKNSFTLIEILVVLSILIILGLAFIILIDPFAQIKKSKDTSKKNDLNVLKKVLEDWYNDKGCYPKAEEICYDSPTEIGLNSWTCHICRTVSSPPGILSYLTPLPCHPENPASDYLYQINSLTCPSWYKIYSTLLLKNDPDIDKVGCNASGCGPANPRNYDYGVTSPNTELSISQGYWWYKENPPSCSSCPLYSDCITKDNVYSSSIQCCQAHPLAGGCTGGSIRCCNTISTPSQCVVCGVGLDCGQDDRCRKSPLSYCSCP